MCVCGEEWEEKEEKNLIQIANILRINAYDISPPPQTKRFVSENNVKYFLTLLHYIFNNIKREYKAIVHYNIPRFMRNADYQWLFYLLFFFSSSLLNYCTRRFLYLLYTIRHSRHRPRYRYINCARVLLLLLLLLHRLPIKYTFYILLLFTSKRMSYAPRSPTMIISAFGFCAQRRMLYWF